jgi:two-component system, chemotaxis family, chemotaxis protein CheY
MAYNILITDDSDTVRAVVVKTLRLSGLPLGDLREASDGAGALDQLREHWIDLVLADINMPVMNGLELVANMKADDTLNDIPVIIVSTEGSKTRIEDLKRQGIAAFVRKPFTPESLKAAILSAMNRKGDA